MDILSNWLAPTIIRELGAVLKWKGGTSNVSQSLDNVIYEDDGSNLRVKFSPSNPRPGVVQITKCETYEGPIRIVISDSYTYVRATVAALAARRYTAATKRRVTEDTLGQLIQIVDFEIVATHLGPRARRATILINDFKTVGDKCGAFGSPRFLESLQDMKDLQQQLITLRAREVIGSQLPVTDAMSEMGSPPHSQLDSGSWGDESSEASQPIFATQVSHHRSEHRPLANVVKPGCITKPAEVAPGVNPGPPGRHHQETLISSRKPAKAGVLTNSNEKFSVDLPQVESDPSAQNVARITMKTTVNTPNDLLGLLSRQQKAKRAIPVKNIDEYVDALQPPVQQYAAQSIEGEVTPATPSRMNINGSSPSPVPLIVNESLERGKESEKSSKELYAAKKAPESLQTQTVADRILALVETSTEGENPRLGAEVIGVLTNSIECVNGDLDLYKSFNRITARAVKISKDQQTLLDREDSWLPAEPGQRAPVANVPIAILEIMNNEADRFTRHTPDSRKAKVQGKLGNETISRPSQSSSKSMDIIKGEISESEAPMSSSEWPTSSPTNKIRDELPPDSSVETTNESDTRKDTGTNRLDDTLSVKDLSSASESSTPRRSTISVRRNPIRTLKATQSTALSPPIRVGTPSSRSNKILRCQVSGCAKSYKSASGFKYHQNKHHDELILQDHASHSGSPKSSISSNSQVDWYACPRCEKRFETSEAMSCHGNSYACSGSQINPLRPQASSQPDSPQLCTDAGRSLLASGCCNGLESGQGASKRLSSQAESSPGILLAGPPNGTYSSPHISLIQDEFLEPNAKPGTYVSPYISPVQSEFLEPDGQIGTYVSPYVSPIQSEHREPSAKRSSASIPRAHSELRLELLDAGPSVHDISKLRSGEGHQVAARSSPESELETTVPLALIEAKDVYVKNLPMQQFPSTAVQSEEPFLQVKRTPYMNDSPQEVSLPRLVHYTSSSRGKALTSLFGSIKKQIGHVILSDPLQEIDCMEAQSPNCDGQMDISAEHDLDKNECPAIEEQALIRRNSQAGTEGKSVKGQSFSNVDKDSGSAVEDIVSPLSPSIRTTNLSHHRRAPLVPAVKGIAELKRKSSEPVTLSPNMAKRRKQFKAHAAFKFGQDQQAAHDPSIMARTYRQEFLAMRKSSTSDDRDENAKSHSPEKTLNIKDQNRHDPMNNRMGNDMNGEFECPPSNSEPSPLGFDSREERMSLAFLCQDEDVLMTVEKQDDPFVLDAISQIDHNKIIGNVPETQDHKDIDVNAKSPEVQDLRDSNINHVSLPQSGADLQNEVIIDALSLGEQDGQDHTAAFRVSLSPELGSEAAQHPDSFLHKPIQASQVSRPDETETQTQIRLGDIESEVFAETEAPDPSIHFAVNAPSDCIDNIFYRFKSAYPDYTGDLEHFIAICRRINALVQVDRMEHRSLWDDFIVRHRTDYSQYLQRCALRAEDAVPYERFYREEIDEPKHTIRIISPKNLDDVLALAGENNDVIEPAQQRSRPRFLADFSRRSTSSKSDMGSPREPIKSFTEPARTPLPQPTVDLTNESEELEAPVLSKKAPPVHSTSRTPRRSLPWMKSGSNKAPISLKHRTSDIRRPTPSKRRSGLMLAPLTPSKSKPADTQRSNRIIPDTPPKPTCSALKSRLTGPNIDTVMPETGGEAPKEWWQDDSNPFKQFARAYSSIKSGNSNSYAQERSAEQSAAADNGKVSAKGRDGELRVKLKKLNVQDWHL